MTTNSRYCFSFINTNSPSTRSHSKCQHLRLYLAQYLLSLPYPAPPLTTKSRPKGAFDLSTNRMRRCLPAHADTAFVWSAFACLMGNQVGKFWEVEATKGEGVMREQGLRWTRGEEI